MKNYLILGAFLTLLASIVPLSSWSQTQVTVSVRESYGGCGLQTDCDNDVICVDIMMTFLQTNTLSAYNIWVSYDGDVISREAWNSNNALPIGDNSCEIANGAQDTDQENLEDNPDFWRVAADASPAFPMPAGFADTMHTICFIILNPALLEGQQICVGGIWEGVIPSTVAFGDGSDDEEDIPVSCMIIDDSFISCSLLPVELLSFHADRYGSSALLTWTTAQEMNSAYFEIQRAGEDKAFETIGRVAGAGFSSILQSYEFIDKAPLMGNNYYRLRQVDNDGSHSISEIRSLRFDGRTTSMEVWPNPAHQTLHVELGHSINQPYRIQLIGLDGRVVIDQWADGLHPNTTLNLQGIAPGLYQVVGLVADQRWTQKVVITD